jgi:hypothetical protein
MTSAFETREISQTSPCGKAEHKIVARELADVRLNPVLQVVCSNDMQAFCSNVVPGEGRVLQCLKRNTEMAGFSASCMQVFLVCPVLDVSEFKKWPTGILKLL